MSFDPNIRRKLWSIDEAVAAMRAILPLVDDLLLSEDEALAIAGAHDLEGALDWLAEQQIARIVVRRGADGAVGRVRTCRLVNVAAAGAGTRRRLRRRRGRVHRRATCTSGSRARRSRRRLRPAHGRRATS